MGSMWQVCTCCAACACLLELGNSLTQQQRAACLDPASLCAGRCIRTSLAPAL